MGLLLAETLMQLQATPPIKRESSPASPMMQRTAAGVAA